LLLIDEPEICLHPNAIRDACTVLYDLPNSGNWQVMVTTHSPVFVDFSRDNTTIIKVEKNSEGSIQGTTVFRPDTARIFGLLPQAGFAFNPSLVRGVSLS
jgi:putative ATP-dependent endonuclease of OLD family